MCLSSNKYEIIRNEELSYFSLIEVTLLRFSTNNSICFSIIFFDGIIPNKTYLIDSIMKSEIS